MISVNVVITTPPAIAGSYPNFLKRWGNKNPKIAAASKLKIIAREIAKEREGFANQKVVMAYIAKENTTQLAKATMNSLLNK